MTHQSFYAGHALLVEDDPFMQQSVASFLADLGFAVSSATTHAQAMSLLHDKTNAFSLAMLDVSLPEHSNEDTAPRTPLGLAIARHVKQTRPQIGVVVWSAYTHHLPDMLALIEEGYIGLAFVPKGSRAVPLPWCWPAMCTCRPTPSGGPCPRPLCDFCKVCVPMWHARRKTSNPGWAS